MIIWRNTIQPAEGALLYEMEYGVFMTQPCSRRESSFVCEGPCYI